MYITIAAETNALIEWTALCFAEATVMQIHCSFHYTVLLRLCRLPPIAF